MGQLPRGRRPAPPPTPLAKRLLARRRELGMSREQVAQRWGHHASNVARYERLGHVPSETWIDSLAAALALEPDELRALAGYPLVGARPSHAAAEAAADALLRTWRPLVLALRLDRQRRTADALVEAVLRTLVNLEGEVSDEGRM